MISIPMLEKLADMVGPDDPQVMMLVENAKLFPDSRDTSYRLLQAMLKQKGLSLGKEPAFGIPSKLPAEGRKIGDAMAGDTVHGACRFGMGQLPGNVGLFGGSGTGKSSLAGLMCEWWIGLGICVIILDVADEYGWLIHRFGVDRLLVIQARYFPLGIFVNPVGSCLSPLAWLSRVVGVLREALFLRDGTCNLLLKIVGSMYREHGVFEGSRDYPTATEVFQHLVTSKFSVQSRNAGFLESAVNRFHGMLQSFPGMNAKNSLVPEQVCRRSLIIRMADLSPQEIDVFGGLLVAWLLAYKEGKI